MFVVVDVMVVVVIVVVLGVCLQLLVLCFEDRHDVAAKIRAVLILVVCVLFMVVVL